MSELTTWSPPAEWVNPFHVEWTMREVRPVVEDVVRNLVLSETLSDDAVIAQSTVRGWILRLLLKCSVRKEMAHEAADLGVRDYLLVSSHDPMGTA